MFGHGRRKAFIRASRCPGPTDFAMGARICVDDSGQAVVVANSNCIGPNVLPKLGEALGDKRTSNRNGCR